LGKAKEMRGIGKGFLPICGDKKGYWGNKGIFGFVDFCQKCGWFIGHVIVGVVKKGKSN
jgi:hypothetical protein